MKRFPYIFCIYLICLCGISSAQYKQVLIAEDTPSKDLSPIMMTDSFENLYVMGKKGLYSSKDTGRTWHLGPTTQLLLTYPEIKPAEGKLVKNMGFCSDLTPAISYATWTQIGDSSVVFYAEKPRNGKWNAPERISVYPGDTSLGDSTLMGAVCCLGPKSELYTAWAGPQGLMFRNVRDKNTLAEKMVAPQINGWLCTVGKNIKCNGLPSIACDLSQGEYRGRIYICWSDEKHGIHNKNVFLIYSDDKGENWTEPIVVTYRPNHQEQFMPYMTIDQSNGNVWLLYFDQQNFTDGDLADLYLARSSNGGLKFEYYKINANPIKPNPITGYGSRLGLYAVNNTIRPLWQQQSVNNKTCMYTALVDEEGLARDHKNDTEDLEIQKTFAWSPKIKIDFTLKNNATVSALITKPLEAGFEKTIIKNKKMLKGKNSLVVDPAKLGVQKGNYTITFYYNLKNTFVWILEE